MTPMPEKRFDIFDMAQKLAELPSLTTYADALTALIRRECENEDIAGHRFTFSYKSCANCVHELLAVDSSDGKRYTVTIQAERTT